MSKASEEKSMRLHQFETVELSKKDSYDINRAPVIKDIQRILEKKPITPKQRKQARDANTRRFDTAVPGEVTVVLGSTGTGKTTTFMLNAIDDEDMYILVVPSNSAVENAKESLMGILESIYPDVDEDGFKCGILTITAHNSKGWMKELRDVKKDKSGVLVICNASFFKITMHYWFNNSYEIMIDEPDDKSNPSVSPTAILACDMLKQKMTSYKIPKFFKKRDESLIEANERYYDTLKDMYVDAGNSYNEEPESISDYKYHCKRLKENMTPYEGCLYYSSATFPKWLTIAIESRKIPYQVIEMEKPSNPRFGVYLTHYDDVIKKCLKNGNMDEMYPVLQRSIIDRIRFVSEFMPTFRKSVKHNTEAEQKLLIDGARKILVVMPGMAEVCCLQKSLEKTFDNDFTHRFNSCYVVTPNNRNFEMFQDRIEGDPNAIIIEIIPSHEARGLNFNAMTIFIPVFCRMREQIGNKTRLSIEYHDYAGITQAEGRAGRLGPCTIFYCGSIETFESLDKENKFSPDGLNDMILGLISRGLHQNEFHRLIELFQVSTGYDLTPYMTSLISNEFVEVLDDGHYYLTRSGNLFNLFHEEYNWYVDIEEYLFDTNTVSEENLFKMLLWLQLYVNLINGKNTLFKFPETQGIRDSMCESRENISDEWNGNIYSHFTLVWAIVNKIYDIHHDDLTVLKRYSTYKFNIKSKFESTPLGIYANTSLLDTKTIRHCCATALNQWSYILDKGLLNDVPYRSSDEFNFDDFMLKKTMQDCANGHIQIATKVKTPTDIKNGGLYVGADGFKYMVYYDLVEQSHNIDSVLIVSSVVKPSMLEQQIALATVILPTSILDNMDDIGEMLLRQGIDVRYARAIHQWLQIGGECPFDFIESEQDKLEILIRSLLGEEIKISMIDKFTYNLLKSIKNMKSVKLTQEEQEAMEEIFGQIFKEHVRENISSAGASMIDMRLPKPMIDVAGVSQEIVFDKFKVDTVPETAFTPYVVSVSNPKKKGFNKPKLTAIRYDDKSRKDYTTYQVLHCSNVEKPVCCLCQSIEHPKSDNITIVMVQKRDKFIDHVLVNHHNAILIPYHTECFKKRDPDSCQRCPYTGGKMFDIGMNKIPLTKSKSSHSETQPHQMMDEEKYIGYLTSLVPRIDSINMLLNTDYNEDSLTILPMEELERLYHTYMDAYTTQRDMERHKIEQSIRKAKFDEIKRMKQERRRIKENDEKRRVNSQHRK